MFRFLEPVAKLFRERARRSWMNGARAHVEFRRIEGEELDLFSQRVRQATTELQGVRWVQVNAHAARVIFEFDAGSCTLADLVKLVEEAEHATRVATAPFVDKSLEHPGDWEPAVRQLVELSADAVATLWGLALRVSPVPAVPFSGNAAAILSLVMSTERLRSGLEERLGTHRAELILSLSHSLTVALAQRPMTAFVDVVHKTSLLRETQARRQVWTRVEPELCGAEPAVLVGGDAVEARPCELPRGPIEEYADRAWFVAAAGFMVSFATTRSVQRAVSAIYGSLPRPARLGRDVFCAELGRMLSLRDALVFDPQALRRLDRIDCLVIDGDLAVQRQFAVGRVLVADTDAEDARRRVEELFDPAWPLERQSARGWELGPYRLLDAAASAPLEEQARALARSGAVVLGLSRDGHMMAAVEVDVVQQTGVEELISAAHDAQMRVVVASDDESLLQAVQADDVIPGRAGMRAGIRRLQREGRAVCVVSRGSSPGLAVADCGIGLRRADAPAPWGAHIVCRDDLSEVTFLIRASMRARTVSKQAVNIALGAAALGAVVSAGGLLPLTSRRVLFVVNTAALISMMNGVRGARVLAEHRQPRPRDNTPWHALDPEGALARLQSSREGLGRDHAIERLRPAEKTPSALRELTESITEELFNPLAPLLAAGAGLSAAVGSVADAAMVGSVVGLNAVIGGAQRFRTERKIRHLATTEERRALVRRAGHLEVVEARRLVVGDIVLLSAGDVVPADCRIIDASGVEVDASSQTGESLPVRKSASPSFELEIADRTSMLYEGTAIASGQATAIVVAVGDDTESRRAAAIAKAGRTQGGVEKRLRSLMALTAPIAVTAGIGVVGGGLLRGRKLEDLVGSAVSLAVASVPEGLPLLATAAQLSAAERLSGRGALVRNARSIEALGRVDVICLDKTGTITEGRLALSIVSDGRQEEAINHVTPARLRVLAAGMRATIGAGTLRKGDPTDEALRQGAQSAAVDADYTCDGWTRVSELSLEVGRAYHAVAGRWNAGALLSVKGAPEAILLQCTGWCRGDDIEPLDDAQRLTLVREATGLARRGLRVLAVAERAMAGDARLSPEQLVDLNFRGFLAFSDALRPTAARAIDGLRRAGVRTVMITGDHPSTAQALAEGLDLMRGRSVLTGAELAALSDEQLDRRVADVAIFARVTPSQKVRVVRALQRAGRVVAMAGDGANDAPAIRLANVGIAVGEASTAAARGAADIVLTDGRIETLVDAIVEGRAMWASVRDAVSILMGGNLGEIGFTLAAGLVDGRPPLHARQLLLVNLFTDVAPALAIALKPPTPRTFEALARETPDAALGQALDRDIAARAVVTSMGAGSAWAVARLIGTPVRARTVALTALVGTQLAQTMASGGFSAPVVLTSVTSALTLSAIIQTPGVSHFFGCRPMGPIGWATAIGASVFATRMSPRVQDFIAGLDVTESTTEMPELLPAGIGPKPA